MVVGLGTGSTVAHLLHALAARSLDITCVATSPQTFQTGRALGLEVVEFGEITSFDIAIDGTDQVDPDGWLVKGGGAAHTREKIVAASARRFVVMADSSKVVARLTPPIPLELLAYGAPATMARLGHTQLRAVPPSPDGGIIADYTGPFADPAQLAALLCATPGVVDHGLFSPGLVADIFIARGAGLEHRELR